MPSPERGLSHDSTVYSYQLLKKYTHSAIVLMLFALFFILALIGNLMQDQAFYYIVCFPAVLVLHMIVGQIYLWMVHLSHRGEWGLRFGMYWMGLAPVTYCPLSLVIRVQTQVLLGGILIIGTLYPWLGPMRFLNLFFVHLWVLVPRFIVFFSFRSYKPNGMVKINRHDTSCYLP